MAFVVDIHFKVFVSVFVCLPLEVSIRCSTRLRLSTAIFMVKMIEEVLIF